MIISILNVINVKGKHKSMNKCKGLLIKQSKRGCKPEEDIKLIFWREEIVSKERWKNFFTGWVI